MLDLREWVSTESGRIGASVTTDWRALETPTHAAPVRPRGSK